MATCFSTGSGWYCGCLITSDSFSPRVSWSRVALSRSDANCANAARLRYWARSSLSGAATFFIALVCASDPTRLTEMPMLSAGRWPALNRSVSRKIWPSVIEMTLVGMYADTSPAWVSMIGRAVSEPPPLSSFMRAARSRSRRVQVEDVARVCLAARRAAQQERHLAVRPGVLGQVVVHAQRVLDRLAADLDAVLHDLLAHRAARIRREVLERGRVLGTRDDDDRVLHRAVLLERGHGLGHGRELLADGHVDADQALALLVDDRVDRDRGLAGLAVADDQLALAAADRDQRVDGLDARSGPGYRPAGGRSRPGRCARRRASCRS